MVRVVGLGGLITNYNITIQYVESLTGGSLISNWVSFNQPLGPTPNTPTIIANSVSPGVYPFTGAFVRTAYVYFTAYNSNGVSPISTTLIVQQHFTSNQSNGYGATVDMNYYS